MKERLLNVSIQTKIMGLVIALIIFIIFSLLGIFVYADVKHVYKNTGDVSLQTAKMISFMPEVKKDMRKPVESEDLQHLVERVRNQIDANYIVITDRDGGMLTHSNPEQIGKSISMNGSSFKAVVFGGYYTVKTDEIIGASLTGKAPIFNQRGQILGVVTVGFLIDDIKQSISSRVKRILFFAVLMILTGIFVSIFLAKHIRRDTLGLEPKEIATLFRDRNTILSSIDDGIIAIDPESKITMLNLAAAKLFHINNSSKFYGESIKKLLPDLDYERVLKQRKKVDNVEINVSDQTVILNMMPVIDNSNLFGGVITLRDKTEIQKTVNTLSEVQRYSEDLRAQTHEFTNKLYAISGLMQLEYYEDAIRLIQSEIETNELNNRMVFEQIKDPKVQAILLGKLGKASEKKIDFQIDPNSSLETLPPHIKAVQLTTIIGNLADNAFEEVLKKKKRNVSFFALDLGKDIIFEVTDNGDGIPEEAISSIFENGFSTKGSKNRGFGLANVKRTVSILNGDIHISYNKEGTTFTVYLPKEINQGEIE